MLNKFLVLILCIFAVQNAFSQWTEYASPVTSPLRSVSVVDNSYFWGCGDNGAVLKTTNAGAVWQSVAGLPILPSTKLVSIYGVSSTNAFVVGINSTSDTTFVYRTTNGGTLWTITGFQKNGYYNAVWIKPPLGGFLLGNPVGGNWTLYSSNSSGGDWQLITPQVPANTNEIGGNNFLFISSTKTWFGTNQARIYYSTTDGATFVTQSLPAGAASDSSGAIWFNYTYSGMVGANQGLYKTSNSGTNWNTISTLPGSGLVTGVAGASLKWFVARGNQVFYSNNDGLSWQLSYTAPGTSKILYLTSSRLSGGSTNVVGVRTDGGIFGQGVSTGISEIESAKPESYSLSQNYPNPFNPTTNIRYHVTLAAGSSTNNSFVSLKIFDVLGREVVTLVNEEQNAGTYEVSFDASKLPSGIYFYTLSSGDYKETRRMVLLK